MNTLLNSIISDKMQYVRVIPRIRKGSSQILAAGRALRKLQQVLPAEREMGETISCLSGFLINLVQKSVKLTCPVAASAEFPDGMLILEEDVYDGVADLVQKTREMALKHCDVGSLKGEVGLL
jgi:hypothetical protein